MVTLGWGLEVFTSSHLVVWYEYLRTRRYLLLTVARAHLPAASYMYVARAPHFSMLLPGIVQIQIPVICVCRQVASGGAPTDQIMAFHLKTTYLMSILQIWPDRWWGTELQSLHLLIKIRWPCRMLRFYVLLLEFWKHKLSNLVNFIRLISLTTKQLSWLTNVWLWTICYR